MRKTLQLVLTAAAVACSPYTMAQDSPAQMAKSRAEVRAEALMAIRAGLPQLQWMNSYDVQSPEAVRANAKFEQLMDGPAYAAELRRQEELRQHRADAGNPQFR